MAWLHAVDRGAVDLVGEESSFYGSFDRELRLKGLADVMFGVVTTNAMAISHQGSASLSPQQRGVKL